MVVWTEPDTWMVEVDIAQARTSTGAPTGIATVNCVVSAHTETEARLIACQMAACWAPAMPIADRVISVVC